jgi:hypothetical protein
MEEDDDLEMKEFFGLCLRVALAKKGRSQNWLHKETGKSREFINNICKEKRCPSVRTINTFCSALDMCMSDFIKGGE